jgi:hypothetical protein
VIFYFDWLSLRYRSFLAIYTYFVPICRSEAAANLVIMEDSTSNDPERVVSGFMWGLRKVASDFGIVGLRALPGLTGSN